MKIRRKRRKRAAAKVKTVYKSRPRRKARRTRRAAAVRRVHVMKPRRVRRRKAGMLGGSSGKIKNIVMRGAVAAVGAGVAIFVTNTVSKMMGPKIDAKNRNWLFLGLALALGYVLPKINFTRKYAAELTTGAVAIAAINLAKTSLNLKYFDLAGSESDELDQIISNLNVAGEMQMLGAREVGGEDSELNLLGISEVLGDMENDYSEDFE